MSSQQRDPREYDDELQVLREENKSLKQHHREQEDKMRQLGTQMVRIREGLQNQAVQKETVPVKKAGQKKELSQADKIAQLELELAQRDAKEEKMSQQVTYYKHVAFSQAQPSRGGARPTKRMVRPSSAPGRPTLGTPAAARTALTPVVEAVPSVFGDGTDAGDDRTNALLQMLQDKERQILELQQQQDRSGGALPASAGSVPLPSLASGSAHESAQLVEVRRNLKDRTAKLTVLQQRFDHLQARFNTLRDNHDKVLAQMQDLNRVIRDERMENTRLKQENHSSGVLHDDLQEKQTQIETLLSEKQAAEDENRRLIAQAFSDAEANELAVTKQALMQRDGEIKRLKHRLSQLDDRQKVHDEKHTTLDQKLEHAHQERDAAKRNLQKVQAEQQLRLADVEGLERRVALLVGDSGVAPEDLERALAMVRDAGRSGAGGAGDGSLRLQDMDLNALGLSPLAKKQVQEILIQNSELIMQLEKTEQLLKIAQKMSDTLKAELESRRRSETEERTSLQKQLALRTQELAEAKSARLHASEQLSSLASAKPGAASKKGVDFDTMSVADSVISEGDNDELDVRPDENVFELHIVSAKLQQDYFSALPATFMSFDFFQHDTQATPLRQGLTPEYDFTAQYILVVDDLFMTYAAKNVLTLDLHQSWGVEVQLVARCDVPLRELLQAKRGKMHKYAQIFSVPPSAEFAGSDAQLANLKPRVVGSVVYEMRMRRRIDVEVHSFMQRFPDIASLALAPLKAGQRAKEALITVRSCSSLRLRPHGQHASPYVTFEFFEFGMQETSAGDGSDPRFEQSFRFPVDLDGEFGEYLKQASLRFTVFDENEEESNAMLGQASMPLAQLLANPAIQNDLPLQDLKLQPAGTLVVAMELRDVSQPKPINLQAAGSDADTAAVTIQSIYRGSATRKTGGAGPEGAVDLVLRVHRMVLSEAVQQQEANSSVSVEVDFLGLAPELKTKSFYPKISGNNIDFEHAIHVKSDGAEAEVLRRLVLSSDDQDSDIFLTAVAATSRGGTRSLGVAYVNLKEQWKKGRGVSISLPIKGNDERPVGTLDVSLDAAAAVHRAVASDAVRVDVMELLPNDALRQDTSVGDVWVEVDLFGLADATELRTKPLRKGAAGPLDFGFSHTAKVTSGSKAQKLLQKALRSADEQDSDVYFVLKGRTPQGTERELGEGFLNLEAMLREGADKVRAALQLKVKGGGVGPTLMVSLLAVEALRRLKAPPADDTLRIDVGQLTLAEPAKNDKNIDEVFVEIDVMGLAGEKPLQTPALKRKGGAALHFEYSQTLALPDGSTELKTLRDALVSKEEQDSDIYFTVKTRDVRGAAKELGQGFVNLEKMGKANKDVEGATVDIVASKGATVVASLNLSVLALGVMRRALAVKGVTTQAVRIEVSRLILTQAVRKDPSILDVWVEVDLVGLSEAGLVDPSALRTKPVKKAAAIDFGYAHSVGVAPGSREQQELANALRSADEQDADVYFALKTRGASGERELGQGYVNLRSLLRDQRDIRSTDVKLQSGQGSAGTVTVSVLALEALRAASAPAAAGVAPGVALGVAPGVAPVDAFLGKSSSTVGGRSDAVRVDVSRLSLSPAVTKDTSVTDLYVEVDLFGLGDPASLRTKPLKKAATIDFGYTYSAAVAPGSKAQAELANALRSADEQDADVYFALKTRGASGERELGQGYVNLRSLLRDQRDIRSTDVKLQSAQGSAGTVTVSVLALEALRAASGQTAAGAAPVARQPLGASGSAPSLDEQLMVRLDSLTLGASSQRSASQQRFFVSIEFLGAEFQSRDLVKPSTAAPLQINQQFAFPVDSAHPATQQKLIRAMRADATAAQSAIQFRLYYTASKDEGEELADGSVNLRKLWEATPQQELQGHRLALVDPDTRETSYLVISTNVLPALKRILRR